MVVNSLHLPHLPSAIVLNKLVIQLPLIIFVSLVRRIIHTIYSYMRASYYKRVDPFSIPNSPLYFYGAILISLFHSLLDFSSTCLSNVSEYFSLLCYFCLTCSLSCSPLTCHFISHFPIYIYLSYASPLLTEDDSSMSRNV